MALPARVVSLSNARSTRKRRNGSCLRTGNGATPPVQPTGGRGRAGTQRLNAMAEEHLRAELEFWHELELLSGQREHFKPGRTDETAYLDDEVAA